jgi:hypothetical protein
MNHNKFRWDYPSQGTRFARTSAEAFGPYGMMPMRRKGSARTKANYIIVAALVTATTILFFFA